MIKLAKWKKFWSIFEKSGKVYSKEFKQLIEKLLSTNPEERPDM
jgi:hypothetical protein